MATVAAVYSVAPLVRSAEDFLQSLMPRQPGDKTKARTRTKAKTRAVRPRPVAKRVWASLEREPGEVVAEAMLEAERHDPERVKHWVVLVDGAETQLDLVEAGAAAYGVDVTVILDIIHVVEYVWKAAHVFHREGSPELACWAWTRVRDILEGKARRVASSMRRAATVAGLSPDARKPVDTCADYLLKYAPYLQYDRAEAAGAARQRRLQRVLGLPRSAGVRAEPRPTLRWRESTAGHQAAPAAFLTPPSTGQVALTMPLAERSGPLWTADEKEPHPYPIQVTAAVRPDSASKGGHVLGRA